jgi:hypothetical protein
LPVENWQEEALLRLLAWQEMSAQRVCDLAHKLGTRLPSPPLPQPLRVLLLRLMLDHAL